ncbi:MAG: DUF445 family protein [Desulfocapsaceae bacterium]|nr:DUF445 family protein [Desulfocapsaceae bacterium]
MFETIAQITLYTKYLIPPLIGAFIGYLTNKIAIRMLFRPLRAHHILGMRIPLTPGIIPAKRHQLAVNIGEMVGSHLLTTKEIGRALEKPSFQQQLSGLIKSRTTAILDKEFGSLVQLVPAKYVHYFDIGTKTLAFNIKQNIHSYLSTQEFENLTRNTITLGINQILERDIDSFATRDKREVLYTSIHRYLDKALASKTMEQWLEDFFYSQASDILKKKKTLQQILPTSLCQLILDIVEAKTPDILEKISILIKDDDIQEKIIQGIKKGVDSFSSNLGPMGGMVQNFLSVETIEKAVKDYLANNEEDIANWLSDKEVQKRVAESLLERVRHYLNTPIVEFLSVTTELRVGEMCSTVSRQIFTLLRKEGVTAAVATMVQENIEVYIDSGGVEVGSVLEDMVGSEGLLSARGKVAQEIVKLIRSAGARDLLDTIIDQLFQSLLQKPIGKISHFMPEGIQDVLQKTVHQFSAEMLATEVPGLFASLNVQHIVTEKVDSLDLLRLERLLLSIMEEQFKYINLFGALLGFLIGSLNVLLLYFI